MHRNKKIWICVLIWSLLTHMQVTPTCMLFWMFLSPAAESGNYMIPHKERGRWGGIGKVRFQSSPEGQVRILVWNILTLYAASIKVCSLLPSIPVCCLLLLSSLHPSASIFSLLFIFSSLTLHLNLSFFPIFLFALPFSLLSSAKWVSLWS